MNQNLRIDFKKSDKLMQNPAFVFILLIVLEKGDRITVDGLRKAARPQIVYRRFRV